MEEAINIGHLVIATVSLFGSLGGAIILGWISIRTKIVALELKCVELEKNFNDTRKDVDGLADHLPMMKEEIIKAITDVKMDVQELKVKRRGK